MLITAGVSFAPSVASAQVPLFHTDGETGTAQTYSAQTSVMNPAPAGKVTGQIEVIQVGVTVIQENASKPEWTVSVDSNKSGLAVATAGKICGQLLQALGHLARTNF